MGRVLAIACILVCAIGTGTAFSFDGGGTGTLKGEFKVKSCGSEKNSDVISLFHIGSRGDWSMETSSGSYTGTYNEIRPGKKFSLALDPASYDDLISRLETEADRLCGLPPGSHSINSADIKKFHAKLNKKQTTVKLKLKLSGTHTEGAATGKVSYKFKGKTDFHTSGCRSTKIKALSIMNAVATSDLNADGAMDIVFTEYLVNFKAKDMDTVKSSASSYAVLYLQDRFTPGVFQREPELLILPKAKARDWVPQLLSVAVGDLDEDGITDVALTQKDMNLVGLLLQDPRSPGQFLPLNNFPAARLPVDVAIGDLNGDGISDMAVAGDYLALLINDSLSPGGAFSESIPGVENVSSVAIHDIDGDGRNDLAVTTGDSVVVLLQDPLPATSGTFTTRASYVTGIDAADVAIADLNGDSLPDLAVANRGNITGSVSVHMQNALVTAGFLPGVNYQTGVNSQKVVIDDLNNDSLPDLAVANNDSDGGSVSVLLQSDLNRGVFLAAKDYPGMQGPNDIATGDMNGDGLADLVIADKCSDAKMRPYIRFQDINNPGSFLYPAPLP